MAATAGKREKGARSRASSAARQGNIYDRIAEARAKREAVTRTRSDAPKTLPASKPKVVETEPPAFPLDREAALKPLKEKKTPANEATFPTLVEPATFRSETLETEDKDVASRSRKFLLWGVSALLAALLIGLLLDRAGPGATITSNPTPDDTPIAPTEQPKPKPEMAEVAPKAGIAAQSTGVLPLVAPRQTTAPNAVFKHQTPPEVDVTRPLLSALPTRDKAPVLRDDGAIAALPAFDPKAYRIVVQAPGSISDTELQSIVFELESAGLVAEPRSVNLSISRSNVRYYHEQDAALAVYIAESIGAEARDFTSFRPPPRSGLIEIWLEGRRSGASANRSGAPSTEGISAGLRRFRQSLERAFGRR